MNNNILERIFYVVDLELREQFPEDYWRRCMYVAAATKFLLEALDEKPIIVSGDFICFVVSPESTSARFQGYAGDDTSTAHLWVECRDTILDLMPYYLPEDQNNSSPTCTTAPIAWRPSKKLPSGMTYIAKAKYATDVEFGGMDGLQEKINAFSEACKLRMKNTRKVKPKFKWMLRDAKSLDEMAQRGDPWAMCLAKYENMQDRPANPLLDI